MRSNLSETVSLIYVIAGEDWLCTAVGLSHADIDLVIAGGQQLSRRQRTLLEQLGEAIEALLEVEEHADVGRLLKEGWAELENRSPLQMCLAGNQEDLMLAAEAYAARKKITSPPLPPTGKLLHFPIKRQDKSDPHRPAG
jgi:hypothetical protein